MGRTSSGAKSSKKMKPFVPIANAKVFSGSDYQIQSAADSYFEDKSIYTPQEQSAFHWYSTGAFTAYNNALRGIGQPAHDPNPSKTKKILSGMDKTELKEAITVFRGAGDGEMFGFDGFYNKATKSKLQSLVGGVFTDNAPGSTSVNPNKTFWGLQMKIVVPPGKGRGAYIRKMSAVPHEAEYLLRHNSKYRITGVSGTETNPVVEIQIVD